MCFLERPVTTGATIRCARRLRTDTVRGEPRVRAGCVRSNR
ncbi:hypothetical protein BSLA_02r3251 [Burkholderia stabilis]|nr:hypothetical protein BSLA_02r3251 [Burkholderia stabilis]